MARTTKAQIILAAAKKRMDEADQARDMYKAMLDKAEAIFNVYADIYIDLERQLAPKPRKKSESASPAPPVAKKSSQRSAAQKSTPSTEADLGIATAVSNPGELPETCLTCGGDENATDHFSPSPNFHNYVSSVKSKAEAA